ncbi:MAG: type II toxin-antitoxin system HicB family antitoxin [Candidatus Poribacteria bacterium]|nr:type II toxin-antitoxin system HicB family antitoxin [Candidatus Poribacteria bacterium]
MNYCVVIHKDPDTDYGVTVPDLPGCFAAGETVQEALSHALEAIEVYLEDMLFNGEPIASPRTFIFDPNNSDYIDGVWKTVSVDLSALIDEVADSGNSDSLSTNLV